MTRRADHNKAMDRRVLQATTELAAELSYSPSWQQIADRVGVVKSTVSKSLHRLRDRGLVDWEVGSLRTLVVKGEWSDD